MKKFIVPLLGLIMLSGCTLDRMARNPEFKNKVCNACGGRDTFSTVVKDTMIITDTDTAWIEYKVDCDSLGNALITEINKRDGTITRLTSEISRKGLKVTSIKAPEYILVPRVSTKEYRQTTIEVPEPYVPWYWKWIVAPFAVIGVIASIIGFIKYIVPLILKAIRKGTIGV